MSSGTSTSALHPWQFFVLAGLACATVVTFIARGEGPAAVIVLAAIMGTAALVGMAALRTIRPLVSSPDEQRTVIGHRTRAALEREKMLALRTIKELEFDRAMGKVSEDDFHEMSVRLRARATRLMKQLDASVGYRSQIERDLARRVGNAPVESPARACAACSTTNDPDARFCKACGARL